MSFSGRTARAATALLLCVTVTACFPGNKKNQRYAKLTEGASLLSGIAILAVANTGADCDMQTGLGMPKSECKGHAGLVSGIGLALVVAGLVGFAATVTTAGDDTPPTPPTPPATTTTPKVDPPSTTPTPIAPAPAAPAAPSLMQFPRY